MTDFRVMFPDMDAEVIEAVLRANNGAVDATIDNLLAMTGIWWSETFSLSAFATHCVRDF